MIGRIPADAWTVRRPTGGPEASGPGLGPAGKGPGPCRKGPGRAAKDPAGAAKGPGRAAKDPGRAAAWPWPGTCLPAPARLRGPSGGNGRIFAAGPTRPATREMLEKYPAKLIEQHRREAASWLIPASEITWLRSHVVVNSRAAASSPARARKQRAPSAPRAGVTADARVDSAPGDPYGEPWPAAHSARDLPERARGRHRSDFWAGSGRAVP